MATSPKTGKARRQLVRQLRAEEGGGWLRWLRDVGFWPVLVTLVFWAGAVLIALYGDESLPYASGEKIAQPIVARVTFSQEDHSKTQQDKLAAQANTPSYYRIDNEFIGQICAELTRVYQEARAAETPEQFQEVADKAVWPAAQATYEFLHPRSDERSVEGYTAWVDQLRQRLKREYTAPPLSQEGREPASKTSYILVLDAPEAAPATTVAEPIQVDIVRDLQILNRKHVEGRVAKLAESFPSAMKEPVEAILTRYLEQRPILVYDQNATREAMAQAAATVVPAAVTYEKGKPFVFPRRDEKGRAQGRTPTDLELLHLEHQAYRAFLASDEPDAAALRQQKVLAQGGTAGLFLILTVALFGYVGYFQPRAFQIHTRSIGLAVLLLGLLASARVMDLHPTLRNLLPVPVLLATAILALAYDRRFAMGVLSFVAMLLVLTVRGALSLLAVLLGGVGVIAFMLDDVRTRTQIIRAGFAAGGLMFLLTFAFKLAAQQDLRFSLTEAAWPGLSAVLAATLIQALLPYIERAFRIATSLTLLEWRDENKPLQQLLIREAPGTYNHSLVLGTMAQAAAEAIGANGLLVQVGARYHDIGKIHQSEYFAENQEAGINRHDKLEPRMSLLVVLSHVQNGLALANEYGLPRILHQFIAEHHGTTVVKFFHYAATEKQPKIASGRHDREISDTEFRYKGPKPQTKESAILMLCDGVEGAVRAMHEPTAGRIESVVHSVMMDRLQDGQFDECDITLKELYGVEESLVKSLCRFYHGRVAYPKSEVKPAAVAEKEEPAPVDQTAGAEGPSKAAAR